MVSESCKFVVTQALVELDITPEKVELGKIVTHRQLTSEEKAALNSKIKKVGLEIVEKENGILVDKIKSEIFQYVYHSDEKPDIRFSIYLSDKLNKRYSNLATAFVAVEKTTIEQFLVALKVQRVKELILFGEFSFSQIAFKLHYSSVAHLSKQFKKVAGMTPSEFKSRQNRP
jgi:YesN/AraC family two-component response regulator